jgi:Tfp pilus assembly protein PilW
VVVTTPQSGSSLVGLLVGLALGLLVVGIGVQSFAYFAGETLNQQVRLATGTSQRVTAHFLSAQARHAGGLMPVSATNRNLVSPQPATLSSYDAGADGDVLNVAQPATAGLDTADCLGRNKAVGNQIQSSFWVSSENLRCRPSNESSNQPLSAGWAQMTGEVAMATPVGIQWLPLASAPTDGDGILAYRLCLTALDTPVLMLPNCPLTHRTRTR